mgnify:CR=1 FL=1
MKAFKLARAFGGVFALVLASALYANAGSVFQRPSVSGPSLGDPNTNLDSITQGLQNNTFSNFFSFTTLTIAAGNTTSTLIQPGFNFLTAAVGATGTMIMPTAKPGANVIIVNNTGANVLLFGNSANPFTPGGIDYVEGAISSGTSTLATATYVLTNGLSADCYAPQGGNWWCQSGR